MSDRRLLVLSYCFPPASDPEALLIAKRLKHLKGWRPDVVTVDHRKGGDNALLEYVKPVLGRIIRIPPPPKLPWHRLGVLGSLPDPFLFANRSALRAVAGLQPHRYDALMSWSQWHSVHLVARIVKRQHPRLPWLAHFSDPWVDNSYARRSKLGKRLNERLECSVIKLADALTFTTQETVELFARRYGNIVRSKAYVVPHGFDPALYGDGVAGKTKDRLLIRYLGNFYGPRTPEPLFKALELCLDRDPNLAAQIGVEIIGKIDAGMELLRSAGRLPEGLVTFRDPVSYSESLRLMQTADLLLLIDAPATESVFLPSKLVDYLGSGRPIVGLTPEGAARRVLGEFDFPFADPNDPAGAADALWAGIQLAQAPPGHDRRGSVDRYSSISTSNLLTGVLDGLAQVNAGPGDKS